MVERALDEVQYGYWYYSGFSLGFYHGLLEGILGDRSERLRYYVGGYVDGTIGVVRTYLLIVGACSTLSLLFPQSDIAKRTSKHMDRVRTIFRDGVRYSVSHPVRSLATVFLWLTAYLVVFPVVMYRVGVLVAVWYYSYRLTKLW